MPDRNQLILDYMPLVKATVAQFLKQQFGHHLFEDMLGAGYVKLVLVADRFTGVDAAPFNRSHFSNYVRRAVKSACVNTLREDRPIQTPRKNDALRTGDDIFYDFEDSTAEICLDRVQLNKRRQTPPAAILTVNADLWPHAFEAEERTEVLNFIHGDANTRRRLRPKVRRIIESLVE